MLNTSYTIQMASKISGVGVHTIRAWEKRYKALVPNRDSAGHRTYTKTDIEKLMLLSELCLLGFTISKVAQLSIPELKDSLKSLGKTSADIDSAEFNLVQDKPSIDSTQSMGILMFAMRAYKLDVVHQELGKLKTLVSSRDMAFNLILPLILEIQDLAKKGIFTKIQIESAHGLLASHAGHGLYKHKETRERSSLNVVVSGIEGEGAVISTMVAGLIINHYGFNFSFLGAQVSLEVLLESLHFLQANLVILNATTAVQNFGVSHVHSYLEKLLGKIPTGIEILVLGNFELELEKIPGKRISFVKNYQALDEFLEKKSQ